MKSFTCQNCQQIIFFENVKCLRCQDPLGYIPENTQMSAFEYKGDLYRSRLTGSDYKMCKNATLYNACNWMIPAEKGTDFCPACDLNKTIPNLSIAKNMHHWQILESGKRRLLYSLLRFSLPLISKKEDPVNGLAFEFLKDTNERIQANDRVMTGHSGGVITLNIAEADAVERERRRLNLNEDYRTVLGHFRHESGHYYWQQLVNNSTYMERFLELFGDYHLDYQSGVAQHYAEGPPAEWQDKYISAYASCHPWEDFAETWGHYITIVDTLETADSFGVSINQKTNETPEEFDSYNATTFDQLLDRWLPLTFAVNNINRSGGQPDLYPFVLSNNVIEKLGFVHTIIRDASPREAIS